jgi:sulfur carrier protein ThiS
MVLLDKNPVSHRAGESLKDLFAENHVDLSGPMLVTVNGKLVAKSDFADFIPGEDAEIRLFFVVSGG